MKSPAFSFYVRDWLCSSTVNLLHAKAGTKHVTKNQARGVAAYLFLLCQSWLEDPPGTLPNDDDQLAYFARIPLEEWLEIKPILMKQFPLLPSGRLHNERLYKQAEIQKVRSESGSKGGSKRVANSQAKLKQTLEDEDEDEDGKEDVTGSREGEVYDAYPRKVGRPAALKKIEKAIKNYGFEKILKATQAYAKAWPKGSDLQYCPHPATWFHQERFNDDPSTWRRDSGESQSPRNYMP